MMSELKYEFKFSIGDVVSITEDRLNYEIEYPTDISKLGNSFEIIEKPTFAEYLKETFDKDSERSSEWTYDSLYYLRNVKNGLTIFYYDSFLEFDVKAMREIKIKKILNDERNDN